MKRKRQSKFLKEFEQWMALAPSERWAAMVVKREQLLEDLAEIKAAFGQMRDGFIELDEPSTEQTQAFKECERSYRRLVGQLASFLRQLEFNIRLYEGAK
jgi:hypothetical protein